MKRMACMIAVGMGVATGLSAANSWAAPVPSSTAAVEAMVPNNLTEVRYHRGGAIAAGIALGLLGAAIAPPYYYGPYYYPPYAPYYGPYGGYGPYWGYAPYYGYYGYSPYVRHYYHHRHHHR
jgi:hypothetical protein